MTRGDTIAGWEMKPGKASKLWVKSEEETAKALKAKRFTVKEIYPPKLLSPAQALSKSGLTQTQKKRLEDDLIVTKAGPLRPTKVPIHTKKLSPQMMFSGTPANERPSFL